MSFQSGYMESKNRDFMLGYCSHLLSDSYNNKLDPATDFLRGKYDSDEPSAMFAAIRTWADYLNCFTMNHGADVLTERLSMLYKPFSVYGEYKPWREEAAEALAVALRNGESSVELWYPVAKRPFETVVVVSSSCR